MKKDILMLIIGILIGAIIATGVFYVLRGNNSNNTNMGGTPPTAQGQGGESSGSNTGEPPAKPGENGDSNSSASQSGDSQKSESATQNGGSTTTNSGTQSNS